MYLNPPNASEGFDLPIKPVPKPKSGAATYILFPRDTYVWPSAARRPRTPFMKRTGERDWKSVTSGPGHPTLAPLNRLRKKKKIFFLSKWNSILGLYLSPPPASSVAPWPGTRSRSDVFGGK